MAEAKESLKVFVSGGSESAGLSTVKALLQMGHKVIATANDAAGALAIRQAGALPVYPDLCRASEVLSALQFAKADVVVHCAPQLLGGIPHSAASIDALGEWLQDSTIAVMKAAAQHGIKQVISLSFAYLYDAQHGAAAEGSQNAHAGDYAAMLAAEAALLDSNLPGYLIRCGYIYGGNSRATSDLAETIKRSRPLPDGGQLACWIHEADVAAAIVTLIEAEPNSASEIINLADDMPISPNAFAAAVSEALGLSAPGFASNGVMSLLRRETMRDKLLKREIVVDSREIRERFGWNPRYSSSEAGLDATAMVWRMKDAVNADDYYNKYEDKAADAIAARVRGESLPASVAVAEKPQAKTEAVADKPAPVKAAAAPSSAGPTPWNEDEAKREERRLKALERKAKRAAKSAGG